MSKTTTVLLYFQNKQTLYGSERSGSTVRSVEVLPDETVRGQLKVASSFPEHILLGWVQNREENTVPCLLLEHRWTAEEPCICMSSHCEASGSGAGKDCIKFHYLS